MIITVTPNTSLDAIYVVSAFEKGRVNRAVEFTLGMGGKGANVSWILKKLGVESRPLGFAAGTIGDKLESLLREGGVAPEFIHVEGETRLHTILIDRSDGTLSTLATNTLIVRPEHVEQLRRQYAEALDSASCAVFSGALTTTVPPSLYADMIGMAKARGIPTILDTSEPYLSLGLAAGPAFIKPNREEVGKLAGRTVNTIEDAYLAGRDVLARYGVSVVITLDQEGAVAVLSDRAYYVPPLKVEVVNAIGAGDAVVAGLAASIGRKQPIEEGLRLGFAAAAAVLLTLRSADCRSEDIERLLPQIELRPYPNVVKTSNSKGDW